MPQNKTLNNHSYRWPFFPLQFVYREEKAHLTNIQLKNQKWKHKRKPLNYSFSIYKARFKINLCKHTPTSQMGYPSSHLPLQKIRTNLNREVTDYTISYLISYNLIQLKSMTKIKKLRIKNFPTCYLPVSRIQL